MISKTYSLIRFAGDDSTTEFVYDFDVVEYFGRTQIAVFLKDNETKVVEQLRVDIDYHLSFGEAKVFLFTSLPVGQTLIIARSLPLIQMYEWENQTLTNLKQIELMGDYITMLVQQINGGVYMLYHGVDIQDWNGALALKEDKINKVAISASATEEQYPTAKSVYDFVKLAVESIPSGGLKVPVLIERESELPDISTLELGDYFIIKDMDITLAGSTGKAWAGLLDPQDPSAGLKMYVMVDQQGTVIENLFSKGATWTTGSDKPLIATDTKDVTIYMPDNITVTGATIATVGGVGSCVVDIWKCPEESFPPNSYQSITIGGAAPAISEGKWTKTYHTLNWSGRVIEGGAWITFHLQSSEVFSAIYFQMFYRLNN